MCSNSSNSLNIYVYYYKHIFNILDCIRISTTTHIKCISPKMYCAGAFLVIASRWWVHIRDRQASNQFWGFVSRVISFTYLASSNFSSKLVWSISCGHYTRWACSIEDAIHFYAHKHTEVLFCCYTKEIDYWAQRKTIA